MIKDIDELHKLKNAERLDAENRLLNHLRGRKAYNKRKQKEIAKEKAQYTSNIYQIKRRMKKC